MLLDVFMIIGGLACLLIGGDFLVRGASALAEDLGVSPLFIGLTVVAFGTSAPELSVNLLAATQGNTEISFGNVVGSNIANVGLILGCCAIMRPLSVEGIIIAREIPMMLLATLATVILAGDSILRGEPGQLDLADGLILLLLFCVFLYYSTGDVLRKRASDPLLEELGEYVKPAGVHTKIWNVCLLLLGLGLLVIGGKLAVDGAVAVAESLGVPRVVIGLTIIAIGTSLPELVASGMATWKGKTEIAIGNVIGSNIFNLLLVFGVCSTVTPLSVPAVGGIQDLAVMLLLSALLFPLSLSFRQNLVRVEGVMLLSIFISYMAWRVLSAL